MNYSEIRERARHLKRLSFVIHSGRHDQYARYVAAIVEKLVDSLRIQQATALHAQVWLLSVCSSADRLSAGLQLHANDAGARLA